MCGICNHMLGTRYGSRMGKAKAGSRVMSNGKGERGRLGIVCRLFQQAAMEAGYQAARQAVSQTLNGVFIELINCDSSFNLCVCVCCGCASYFVLFALPATLPARAMRQPFARILKLKLPDLLLMMYDFREWCSLKIKTTFTTHGARYACLYASAVLVSHVFGRNKRPVAHYRRPMLW